MHTHHFVALANPGWGAFAFAVIVLLVWMTLVILMIRAIFKWSIKVRDKSLSRVLEQWSEDERKRQLP